jgi:hypothetical protein
MEIGAKINSSLLQAFIQLLMEIKDKYMVQMTSEWFTSIVNTADMIHGLAKRNDLIMPMLFEHFKEEYKVKPIWYESKHTYEKMLKTERIEYPGASYMKIEFNEFSVVEDKDTILFTYDQEGTQFVETEEVGTSSDVVSDIRWADDPVGPDI